MFTEASHAALGAAGFKAEPTNPYGGAVTHTRIDQHRRWVVVLMAVPVEPPSFSVFSGYARDAVENSYCPGPLRTTIESQAVAHALGAAAYWEAYSAATDAA